MAPKPRKVFLVISEGEVIGVFSTKAKARKYGKEIYDIVLDEVPQEDSGDESEDESEDSDDSD